MLLAASFFEVSKHHLRSWEAVDLFFSSTMQQDVKGERAKVFKQEHNREWCQSPCSTVLSNPKTSVNTQNNIYGNIYPCTKYYTNPLYCIHAKTIHFHIV